MPVYVDVGATTGKTTICLAHCAHRLEGRVISILAGNLSSHVASWFKKALILFKADKIVQVADSCSELADFIVVRDNVPMDKLYDQALRPNGIMLGLGDYSIEGVEHLEKGVGYVAWKKDKEREVADMAGANGDVSNRLLSSDELSAQVQEGQSNGTTKEFKSKSPGTVTPLKRSKKESSPLTPESV